MVTLKGELVYLRALEPEDLDFIYNLENDESIWQLSSTSTPYSKFLIKDYLANAHKDIYEVKQLRMLIANYNNEAIGLIDVFDFDIKNQRAGIGILITNVNHRGKGYGNEALQLLINYCFTHLNLHQLYCDIFESNTNSLKLFERQGFKQIGLKKDWNFHSGVFTNTYLYQLINNVH